MIVRIMGEGQWRVDDDEIRELDSLDTEAGFLRDTCHELVASSRGRIERSKSERDENATEPQSKYTASATASGIFRRA